MTNPPQQPGAAGDQPGPHSEQPGAAGHQPAPGQQPNHGQQPYGAPLGGVGEQPFGQQGQYPPDQFGPPQARKKSPLRWILVGGGVLVIAMLLIVLLTRGVDSSDPKAVAQGFVNALNKRDDSLLSSVLCSADKAAFDQMKKAAPQSNGGYLGEKLPKVNFTFEQVKINGDNGVFTIKSSEAGRSSHTQPLVKEGGAWKVCGMFQ